MHELFYVPELSMDDKENPIPLSGLWDLEQLNMETEQASVQVAENRENTNGRGSNGSFPAGAKKLVLSADLKSYQMTSDPRGLALIIENEEYENEIETTRHGSHKDVLNLKSLFKKLKFKIIYKKNLKRYDFFQELDHFQDNPEHRSGDMMILGNNITIFF